MKNVLKNYAKKIKESANEIINLEKKEMITLTHKENNFYNEQDKKYVMYVKKSFL